MASSSKARKKAKEWPVIRRIALPTKPVWEVDTGYKVRPRIRKRFDTEQEAKMEADRIKLERMRHGAAAFQITPAQRQDAIAALALLKATGATLKEAAAFYVHHKSPAAGNATAKQVYEEMIAFKKRRGARPRYLGDLHSRLQAFNEAFGVRPIAEISPAEIEEWLYSLEGGEVNRDNYFRALGVLFGYAQGKRDRKTPTASPYRADNPLERVTKPAYDRKPPEILSISQARSLLITAQETQGELGLLPYVCLGLFCGIRSSELRQLQWEALRLDVDPQVTVSGEIAKKRRLRNVPIPDNALEWLVAFTGSTGPIAPRDVADKFTILTGKAGIRPWPNNAMRHSFGSYYYASSDDAAATTARLGQKDDAVLFDHYRALTDKREAQAYFSIRPKQKAVVEFKSA